jgi:dipeptidyl-peptidase 4
MFFLLLRLKIKKINNQIFPKMKKNLLFSILFLSQLTTLFAQKKITVEDIWQKGTFRVKGLPGFNFLKDGKHYSANMGDVIAKFDLTTGKQAGVIFESKTPFDDYAFSADESKILFATNSEQIYRHSSKGYYNVWDGKMAAPLAPSFKQSNPTFSPQATHVAFTADNNLYIKDLAKSESKQITKDGVKNRIINGFCDWVYEEEFSFTKAFEWSPDGSKIAFLRFDETDVPEYTLESFNSGVYPEANKYKYPKVGEKNSIVTVWIYDVKKGKTIQVQTGAAEYFPRLKWTPDNQLVVFKLNRLQNELDFLLADAKTGKTSLLMRETRPTFVDVEMNDDMTFLKDGSFIKSSEQDGWNQIYHYGKDGKVIKQLTKGSYDVRKIYGVDEVRGEILYQASKESPMKKGIYAVKIDGSGDRYLSGGRGVNDAEWSSNYDYFVLTNSKINEPPSYAVIENGGKVVRNIEDNAAIRRQQFEFEVGSTEFFSFKTTEGVELNGWMMRPQGFDSTKRYPVFMTQYSGPNSQQVVDQWMGNNYWWYQMLVQKGYLVVCVDPRGTGGRGEAFRKITYKQLGKYETVDQIEAAKWLGKQTYVDSKRIGIFGWSYGGYMSSLCILKGNDVFKTAIAVAPVTNWKWYDSVYTERYMQTEKENSEGYKDNSPVNFADRLKGNYLLIHGLTDDNVHFQNSIEMANALIAANKQYDSYYYPNRNHGIYGGMARVHLYNKMTNFLIEKL